MKAVDACKTVFGAIRQKGASCGTGLDVFFTQTAVDNQCALIQSYADAGTLKYDSSRYAACKSAIDGSSCGLDDPKVGEQCGQVFVGVRAGGESCKSGLECASGNCSITNNVCPGTCRPVADIGGDCSTATNATCKSPYSCTRDTRKCAALAAEGESCANISCLSNLFCDGATILCRAKLAAGADCTSATNGCVSSTSCKMGVCTAPRRVGESCTVSDGRSDCVIGSYCEAGACKTWPTVGGSCGLINNQGVSCIDSYCPSNGTTTATCTAYVVEGGACSSSPQCTSGTSCTNLVCKKQDCN